jgi:hypothetical protein
MKPSLRPALDFTPDCRGQILDALIGRAEEPGEQRLPRADRRDGRTAGQPFLAEGRPAQCAPATHAHPGANRTGLFVLATGLTVTVLALATRVTSIVQTVLLAVPVALVGIGLERIGHGEGKASLRRPRFAPSCGIHGGVRPAKILESTALDCRSLIRMRALVQVQPGPPTAFDQAKTLVGRR